VRSWTAGALVALASLALAAPAAAADPSPYVTDGPVYAIASLGGTTYVGGAFAHVARRSGTGVALHASDGQRDTAFPEVAGGEVDAVASDGSGGWYIGGDFTTVGGYGIAGLAHINPDGTVDTAFNPSPRNTDGTVGDVRAIAVGPAGSADAGTVYVGGSFQKIAAKPDAYLAAVDPSGHLLTGWSQLPQPNDAVNALAVLPVTVIVNGLPRQQSMVFVGGDFTYDGTAAPPQISSSHLAAVWGQGAEAGNGSPLDGNTATSWLPSVPASVRAIVLGTDPGSPGAAVVYAGSSGAPWLAAFAFHAGTDGTVDGVSQYSWQPNPDGAVRALALSGSTLYAGGDFAHVGSAATGRNHLAAFQAITSPSCSSCVATVGGWNPGADGTVRALVVQGSTIYAAGDFGQPHRRLAAFDASGNVTNWDPEPSGGMADALAVSPDGSEIFAGGSFTGVAAQPRSNLAAFDATGNLTAWNPGADAAVHALAGLGSTIYAGGNFTQVASQPRAHLAAIDGNGAPVPGFLPDPDGGVLALSTTGSAVYVGGSFSHIAGATLSNLAALDPNSGAVLPGWSGQADGNVYALDASCSTLYAGGGFANIGGRARSNIAALDPATGQATGWDPGANSTVYALRRFGTVVYAAGRFWNIGTAQRSHIAALDASTGQPSDWNPAADLDSVRALAVDQTTIYAGGVFTMIGDAARSNIAALDPATGQATGWNPGADGNVYALSEADGVLHAGGSFTNLGPLTQQGYGAFVTGTPPDATSAPCTPTSGQAPSPPAGAVSSSSRRVPPPAIGRFWMTHRTFRVGRRPTAVTAGLARVKKKRRAPVGTTFRYLLSEAASVTLTIQQPQRGYVKKTSRTKRCVPTRRLRRRARRCTIYRVVGRLQRSGRPGTNSIVFSGRIGRRALHRGKYVATILATAADGQKSNTRKLSFKIVR
jgi:trimeric autotransporter adhesin